MLLWSQLKNCLELMRKTRDEEKVKVVDLINRRKTLEQRRDHLIMMKGKSRLEPARKVQKEISFKGVEWLHEEVNKLGFVPLDPSKCEVVIPTMIVNKETTLMITVRDINNDVVSDSSEELNVSVQISKGDETIIVGPIDEAGGGRYKVAFTPIRCGYHVISVLVDEHHIPGSPYK